MIKYSIVIPEKMMM